MCFIQSTPHTKMHYNITVKSNQEQLLSQSHSLVPVSDCSCSESFIDVASNFFDNSLKIKIKGMH